MTGSTSSNKPWSGQKRRRHFRILYPESARPELFDDQGQQFQIYDISEEGVKFFYVPFDNQVIPMKLKGTVGLLCGAVPHVEGEIIRVEPELAVLKLEKPIPYKIIHKEELYLIRKFKGRLKALYRKQHRQD